MLAGIEEDVREWLGDGARHITQDEYEGFCAYVTTLAAVERSGARRECREPVSTRALLERLSQTRTARRALSQHQERRHALSVAV